LTCGDGGRRAKSPVKVKGGWYNTSQARRLARLGGCASVNIYLVHYRAEAQSLSGLGPDRAEATARLGSLEREGVVFGLHSDYALVVVPMRPLVGMWIATRRLGSDGVTVLSPGECIGLERAMRAVTIDAAFLLRLENEIGSIEVGKRADFAVLESDPFECELDELPAIKVWGTIYAGVAYQAADAGAPQG
jgi:predicted amidohydrolase YtcJ